MPSETYNFKAWLHLLDNTTPVYEDILWEAIRQSACPVCKQKIGYLMRGAVSDSLRIQLIRHIREESGLDLKEAKDLIDSFILNKAIELSINNSVWHVRHAIREKLDEKIAALQERRDALL